MPRAVYACIIVLCCLWPLRCMSEPVVIKFATLAPEGTPWMEIMEDMNQELQRQSNGQLAFRFYAGGVAGDERDVIRKMRINQLQGGAFSGFGLGDILPQLRVLELPRLFRDAAEANHVATALFDHFAAGFADKSYILLSLNEAGAVYIFSRRPIASAADMARSKIWIWQGDPLPEAIFKAYGIAPVPLSLPNVLPSLQAGLIDACYGTPLTVLALQWFTKVTYRTEIPITRVMGAFLISKHLWQQLASTQQELLRTTVQRYSSKAASTMQRYDDKALALLQATAGLETVLVPEAEATRIEAVSWQVRQDLVGQLYPQTLLDRVLELRNQYRKQHNGAN